MRPIIHRRKMLLVCALAVAVLLAGGASIQALADEEDTQPPGNSPDTLSMPAVLELSNLRVQPLEVAPDETVSILLQASNPGDSNGSWELPLIVNGVEESHRTVVLEAGETSTIEFSTSRQEPGRYDIGVGPLAGSFTVSGPAFAWGAVGALIGVALLGGIVASYVYVRRRQPEDLSAE